MRLWLVACHHDGEGEGGGKGSCPGRWVTLDTQSSQFVASRTISVPACLGTWTTCRDIGHAGSVVSLIGLVYVAYLQADDMVCEPHELSWTCIELIRALRG